VSKAGGGGFAAPPPAAGSCTFSGARARRESDRLLTWQGVLSFKSDQENFYYTYTRRLLKDGELVREKTWDEFIERDHQ
jgi:hypothetical protein